MTCSVNKECDVEYPSEYSFYAENRQDLDMIIKQ